MTDLERMIQKCKTDEVDYTVDYHGYEAVLVADGVRYFYEYGKCVFVDTSWVDTNVDLFS